MAKKQRLSSTEVSSARTTLLAYYNAYGPKYRFLLEALPKGVSSKEFYPKWAHFLRAPSRGKAQMILRDMDKQTLKFAYNHADEIVKLIADLEAAVQSS